jgi:UPF0755 protein
MMKGRSVGAWVAVSFLLLVAIVASVLVRRPSSGNGTAALVTVTRGESVSAVADALREKGLIRSTLVFRLLSKAKGTGSVLKAGTYRIDPGMDANHILNVLASGKQAEIRFSIPEGFSLTQVALLLDRQGVIRKADFLEAASNPGLLRELGIPAPSAEGYLFPDTYMVPLSSPADDIIRLMVRTLRNHLSAIPGADRLSASELHDIVILASIVEREYRVPEEAPLIASVFSNRRKANMPLQSCATIVYIITERLGKPHPEIIYDRDLGIDDPYNTYQQRGLPPGPISNPGMTSLRAAFSPAQSRYLYFRVLDPRAGTHHFSPTLEEHGDARLLFLKNVGG